MGVKTTVTFPQSCKANDTSTTDKQLIVQHWNKYFCNVGAELEQNIPHSNKHFREFLNNHNEHSMFLYPVTETEIKDIAMSLKPKSSNDCYELSMKTLQKVICCITKPLEFIFNKSLLEGIFPQKLKVAKILPFYKTGNINEPSNYRPIALLPQFSKILEKIFEKRLRSFLTQYDIISDYQFGFRPKHSTTHAAMAVLDKLTSNIDSRLFSSAILVDLRKAFDTINHKILLSKLDHYGIRDVALKWLTSYLSGRLQYTCITWPETSPITCNSSREVVEVGVPQGSILGPLLFALYVNDLPHFSSDVLTVLFADDTVIVVEETSLNLLETKVQQLSIISMNGCSVIDYR